MFMDAMLQTPLVHFSVLIIGPRSQLTEISKYTRRIVEPDFLKTNMCQSDKIEWFQCFLFLGMHCYPFKGKLGNYAKCSSGCVQAQLGAAQVAPKCWLMFAS